MRGSNSHKTCQRRSHYHCVNPEYYLYSISWHIDMSNIIKHAYNLLRHQIKDVGLPKRSGHWPTLEKHFLEANPACVICGSKTRLNVHHKKPFHLYPELELEPSNLITLCMSRKECHLLIGHCDNFRSWNRHLARDVQILRKDISQFDLVAAKAKADRVE